MALADSPKGSNGLDEANMSEAEKKKARNKARKAELKAQKEKENKAPKKGLNTGTLTSFANMSCLTSHFRFCRAS